MEWGAGIEVWRQRRDRSSGHGGRCVGRLIADAQALFPVSVVCVSASVTRGLVPSASLTP